MCLERELSELVFFQTRCADVLQYLLGFLVTHAVVRYAVHRPPRTNAARYLGHRHCFDA